MAKMIGLARPLKTEWMDKTADLVLEGKSTEDIKAELNGYLSFEIESPTSLRKTRDSLINLWALRSDEFTNVRESALSLYPKLKSDKLPLHWCLLLLKYPVFSDICALIGKITNIEESFTTAWMREKLYESWGERTSLDVPVKNILRSLVDFGTLEKAKVGVYKTKERSIGDEKVIRLLIITLLKLKKKPYYEISEFSRVPLFFPFKYDVTLEWLHSTPEITIGTFGGKMVVSAKEI